MDAHGPNRRADHRRLPQMVILALGLVDMTGVLLAMRARLVPTQPLPGLLESLSRKLRRRAPPHLQFLQSRHKVVLRRLLCPLLHVHVQ